MFRILIALAVATSTASAQLFEPAPPRPIVPVDTFSAEGADVDTLAKILSDQFPGIKFSADRVSSTIFARVDGEDADRVKRLIEEVQIRAVDANHRRQKIEKQALKEMDRPSPPSAQPEQLFQRAVEMASDIEPALAEQKIRQLTEREFDADQQEMKLLQMQALELAHVVRANEDPKYQAELMEALHQNVSQQFHRKLAHDRREMEQIRRRLDQISQRLEMQERLAGRIIDQRVQELIKGQFAQASDNDLERVATTQLPSRRKEAVVRQVFEQLRAIENEFRELELKERDGEVEEGEKLLRMRNALEAGYQALRQQLTLSESILSPDESEFRRRQNRGQDLEEMPKDRKQSHELQTLEKLELELEKLKAIEQQQNLELQGELAEQKALLEAAYFDLKRRLYPFEEDDFDLEVMDEDEVAVPDNDVTEEEVPTVVPDDSERV